MLQNLSKYICFILIMSFISIIYLNYFFEKFSINSNFLYLFGVLTLVFFDKIIEFIKKDFIFYFKDSKNKEDLFLRIFSFVFFIIILLFFKLLIINFLIISFIIFSIIFRLDSRVSFLIALFLLVYTVFFIFIQDKKIAEELSIYAYYFLIIGVVIEITDNLFFKQVEDEK